MSEVLMPFRRYLVSCAIGVVLTCVAAAQQRDPKQYQQLLENPDRLAALQVNRVVEALALRPGMRVADLGAGTGVFTVPMAKAVGREGRVYAIDIDSALLAIVAGKAKANGLANIETIVAGPTDPRVPEPVDLLFICDTMHHLPDQRSYVQQFAKLLRPGGRVAVIDFAEGHWPQGHDQFVVTPAQVDGWMQAAGFRRAARHTFLGSNFFHVYELSQPQRVDLSLSRSRDQNDAPRTFADPMATYCAWPRSSTGADRIASLVT
jgi:SAM-dependent methyltransferase